MKLVLYTDGASRGNPGPAAFGIVLTDTYGAVIEESGETLGRMTNNEAEYYALLRGLELAAKHRADEIEVRADSEFMVRQLNGIYRVKAGNIKPLYTKAIHSLARFKYKITHVPRERNWRADALANAALDQAKK